MGLELRDWLIIIGPIFVVAVLAHGYWRMRRSSSSLKMSLDQKFKSDPREASHVDDLSLLRAELPSGGARVVSPQTRDSEQDNLDLEKDVPVLMDPVSLGNNDGHEDNDPEPETMQEQSGAGEPAVNGSPDQADTGSPQASADVVNSEPGVAESAPDTIIVVHVISNGEGFNGQQLLENLVTCGLAYGDMDIFHRHGEDSGKVLFSLVNGVEPGTFQLNEMEELTTPAVSLFMKLKDLEDPIAAYDLMMDTAGQLAAEMDGNLKDETHSVLTNQTMEHWRQTIREYSLKYR